MDRSAFLLGFTIPTAQRSAAQCVPTLSSDGYGRAAVISAARSGLCDLVAILAIVMGISAAGLEDQPRWRLFPLCRRHVVTVSGGSEPDRESQPAIFDS